VVKKTQYTKENNQSMGGRGFAFSLHRPVSGFGLQAMNGKLGRTATCFYIFFYFLYISVVFAWQGR
jgi:hypothetical protein